MRKMIENQRERSSHYYTEVEPNNHLTWLQPKAKKKQRIKQREGSSCYYTEALHHINSEGRFKRDDFKAVMKEKQEK